MSERILIINLLIIFIGVPFLVTMWFLPFKFFVDIKYVDHKDVCAGDTVQTVFSLREVKFADQYKGHVYAELVKYEDKIVKETIIKRETDFIYEKNDNPIVYEIEWSHPLPEGYYGVNSIVTIDTIFEKKDYRSAETQRFKVINCN